MTTFLTIEDIEECGRVWQERLGLTDWEIIFRVCKIKPKTTSMRNRQSVQYDRSVIEVQPWVLAGEPPAGWHAGIDLTVEEVEATIVHELLHCHLASLDGWRKHLSGHVDDKLLQVVCTVHDDQEEAVVDRLARALTSSLPPAMLAS